MSNYDSLKHKKFRIRYHIIFSTKYRKKLLSNIRDEILSYMKLSETRQFEIETQEIDKDHIHLLVKADPTIAPYEIVHRLKQFSTYNIWHNRYDYMKKWYYNGKHYLWTRGYFVSTIGDVSDKRLKQYIESQG